MGTLGHATAGAELTQAEFEASSLHTIGGVADLNIVRGASYVVVANDALAHVKAQGDYSCDATADEVQANAAVTAITGGALTTGKVLFSEGNFTTAATITGATGVSLMGSGRATFLNSGGDYPIITITGTDGTLKGDLIIRDMQLTGTGKANTSNHGIAITFGNHVWMEHLYFTKLYSGLYCKGTHFTTLSNFYMFGTGASQMEYGILTEWQSSTRKNESQLVNGLIGNVNSNGVRGKGASGWHCVNVIVVDTTGYAWYFGDESAGQYSEFLYFSNCDADSPSAINTSGWVFILGSADSFEGINMSNCWSGGWGAYGMYFSSGITFINLSNIHIRDVGSHGLESSSNGTKIVGGTIKGWDKADTGTKYGVNFNGISDSILIGVEMDDDGGTTAGYVRDSSGANTIKYNPGYSSIAGIENHSSDDTLTAQESGSTHTNYGAGGAVTLTLPTAVWVGLEYDFQVTTPQELRVKVGAAGHKFIANGTTTTDDGGADLYIVADDEGEYLHLACIDSSGVWLATRMKGTWTETQP